MAARGSIAALRSVRIAQLWLWGCLAVHSQAAHAQPPQGPAAHARPAQGPAAHSQAAQPAQGPAAHSQAAQSVNPDAPEVAAVATLVIRIVGFANDHGQALVALFRTEQGFPDQVRRAFFSQALHIVEREVHVRVAAPAGPIAVAMVHDENRNFRLDTGLFGIPTEGYGVSRDAPAHFGPPKFRDAVVSLRPGEYRQLQIKVRY
jgi:uncharacterized protein (DUF2141 family)